MTGSTFNPDEEEEGAAVVIEVIDAPTDAIEDAALEDGTLPTDD